MEKLNREEALELLKKYGLDTDSIYEKIKAFAK